MVTLETGGRNNEINEIALAVATITVSTEVKIQMKGELQML